MTRIILISIIGAFLFGCAGGPTGFKTVRFPKAKEIFIPADSGTTAAAPKNLAPHQRVIFDALRNADKPTVRPAIASEEDMMIREALSASPSQPEAALVAGKTEQPEPPAPEPTETMLASAKHESPVAETPVKQTGKQSGRLEKREYDRTAEARLTAAEDMLASQGLYAISISFNPGSTSLSAVQTKRLQVLAQNGVQIVQILGYASPSGEIERNDNLSISRAVAAAETLSNLGVDLGHTKIIGRGETTRFGYGSENMRAVIVYKY